MISGWTSSKATANLPGSQRITLPENMTLSFWMALFQKEDNLDGGIWKKGLLRVKRRPRGRNVDRDQQQNPFTLFIRIDRNDCGETDWKTFVQS